MVKNIFYSLFILLSSVHLALSQENYQFSGHLTDKFLDTPIPNAAILIMTEIDTLTLTTDDYGYFDGSFFYIGIADQNIPEKFEILSQNYPNPFNPATIIKYSQPGMIELFDVTGRLLFAQKLVGSNVSKTTRLVIVCPGPFLQAGVPFKDAALAAVIGTLAPAAVALDRCSQLGIAVSCAGSLLLPAATPIAGNAPVALFAHVRSAHRASRSAFTDPCYAAAIKVALSVVSAPAKNQSRDAKDAKQRKDFWKIIFSASLRLCVHENFN